MIHFKEVLRRNYQYEQFEREWARAMRPMCECKENWFTMGGRPQMRDHCTRLASAFVHGQFFCERHGKEHFKKLKKGGLTDITAYYFYLEPATGKILMSL